jgi:fatty acid desaturase
MTPHKHASPNDVLASLPPDAQESLRRWFRSGVKDPAIRRANLWTQFKVLAIYALFAMALGAFLATGGNVAVAAASVVGLGAWVLPALRIYMHSQAHWGVGNGPVRNFLLDRVISVLFGTPQTGYKYGHLAHHRYDNDFDPRGFPKDLQSTYVFSRDGETANVWLWCAFYALVYQHALHLFHVLNAPRRREVLWFLLEAALIAAFHRLLWQVSPAFYLAVYLPALGVAWMVSALTLYMMHAVELEHFRIHPTLNAQDRTLNRIGDNLGYHLEHSLFPNLHPVFLDRASALIQPPPEQVLRGSYLGEGLRLLLGLPLRFTSPPPGGGGPGGEVSMIGPRPAESIL